MSLCKLTSSSEVSGDLSSSPGDDQVIVLVDGEGVLLLVEVEDLHQVTITTNSMGSTTFGNTESLNSFGSSRANRCCNSSRAWIDEGVRANRSS